MCVFIVHVSHWFQLLYYSKAPSKTLAGKHVYSVSGAISKQEAYKLTDTGGSWGLCCMELGYGNYQAWGNMLWLQQRNGDLGLTEGSASL